MANSMTSELLLESKLRNNQVLNMYFRELEQICLSSYEWVNLPSELPEYFIERCLFYSGMVTFFWDEHLGGFVCGRTIPGTQLDVYGRFADSYITCANGYQRHLQPGEGWVVYNNYLRAGTGDYSGNIGVPTMPTALRYADELARIQRAIDVNLSSLSTPLIISGSQKQLTTLNNKVMLYRVGVPFIFVDKKATEVNEPDMTCLQTGTPFLVDQLQDALGKKWNEAMTAIGVDNANTDKRERLNVPEVDANNEQVSLIAQSYLASRNAGIQPFNDYWGTHIYCRRRAGTVGGLITSGFVGNDSTNLPDASVEKSPAEGVV